MMPCITTEKLPLHLKHLKEDSKITSAALMICYCLKHIKKKPPERKPRTETYTYEKYLLRQHKVLSGRNI